MPAPSPRSRSEKRRNSIEGTEALKTKIEPIARSMSIDVSQLANGELPARTISSNTMKLRSVSHSPPRIAHRTLMQRRRISNNAPPKQYELGCEPIFSDSTVSLTSICLNEEIFDEEDSPLSSVSLLEKTDLKIPLDIEVPLLDEIVKTDL